MKVHLYLSLLPEALVLSMLPPEDYGRYLALGSDKRTRGQVLFMEVDPKPIEAEFDLKNLSARCKPHPDGGPHRSSYISIYRVLERIPATALGSMFLVTRDGTTLELEKTAYTPPAASDGEFHLYQEFCPITPQVVSRLSPSKFAQFLTTPGQPVSVPRLVFAELELGALATDPDSPVKNLPYRNIEQVRSCLNELKTRPNKQSKIVHREMQSDLPFWTIKRGILVGDQSDLAFYPMPAEDELRQSHYSWWSSARAVQVL